MLGCSWHLGGWAFSNCSTLLFRLSNNSKIIVIFPFRVAILSYRAEVGVYLPFDSESGMFNVPLVVNRLEDLLRHVSLSILFGGYLTTAAVLPIKVILDEFASQFHFLHLLFIPTKGLISRLN